MWSLCNVSVSCAVVTSVAAMTCLHYRASFHTLNVAVVFPGVKDFSTWERGGQRAWHTAALSRRRPEYASTEKLGCVETTKCGYVSVRRLSALPHLLQGVLCFLAPPAP